MLHKLVRAQNSTFVRVVCGNKWAPSRNDGSRSHWPEIKTPDQGVRANLSETTEAFVCRRGVYSVINRTQDRQTDHG